MLGRILFAALLCSCTLPRESDLPRLSAPAPSGLPSQTAAPSPTVAPRPTAKAASVSGVSSWYATGRNGMYAAAGPALRAWLGPKWRGQRVKVCAGNVCVRLTLNDWCQCYRGEDRERLVDLSDEAFAALAPLSRGLIGVTISGLG